MGNKNGNKIFIQISKLISDFSGIRLEKIDRSTSLSSDLRLDGDDALELLKMVENEFNTDFSGFKFEEYFNLESDIWGIRNFLNKYFKKKDYVEKKEITIQSLIDSIERGYW
jgi:acyl carrier protein